MTRPDSRVVEDPATLKALAHPLRLRLLARLRRDGPATASELARACAESSGSTSYHLRQLERYGFVEPEPEQPSRREKVWRAVHAGTTIRLHDSGDPDALAALDVVVAQQLTALTEGVRRRQRDAASWPAPWREAHLSSDVWLRVTPAGLRALKQAVIPFVEQFEAPDDPDARLVALHLQSFPEEGERP